jgi:hypothetical protein
VFPILKKSSMGLIILIINYNHKLDATCGLILYVYLTKNVNVITNDLVFIYQGNLIIIDNIC